MAEYFLDKNFNFCPQIYSFAANPTIDTHLILQVNEYLAPMRNMGLSRVDKAAYLEKASCHDSVGRHQPCSDVIVRDLGRRVKSPTDLEEHYDIVFVWDIEEITMLTRNCLTEVGMLLPSMHGSTQWLWLLMSRILGKANFPIEFFLEQREAVNIEDEIDEMKIDAPKYNALKIIYNECGRRRKNSILSQDLLAKCGLSEYEQSLNIAAERHQQIFHQRWKYARRSLKLVNKRSAESKIKKYANVVMTHEELALGLCQILISGTSKEIAVENVFSTRYLSEQAVWERIQKKFGEKCLLVHVTTQPINMDWPYRTRWSIYANESIKYLYKAQRDVLLKDGEDEESELVQNESTHRPSTILD